MKGWAKMLSPKPGPQRRKMMKKCGSRCFLRPRNLGYPICVRNTCKQSRKGLQAAVARGKQNHDAYVVNKARRLLKSKKRSSMINNPVGFTDEEIRNRIRGMNGIDGSTIENAVILWRRIYDWSVGAGAGNRDREEPNINMRLVFATETDRHLRFLVDAGIINGIMGRSTSNIIHIASELSATFTSFSRYGDHYQTNSPFLQVYVDNYYDELVRRREANIAPVEIELEEIRGVGGETDMTGLACDMGGCRNQNGVCICRLLEPPPNRVFGKCAPESCGITGAMGKLKHRMTRVS
jgi:hypothetical protein